MRVLVSAVAVGLMSFTSWSQQIPSLREVKIAVFNPTDQARLAEDIVIPFAQLRTLAPGINAGSLIVTVDNADLPSQVDDLDGDGKADELVFQIDLKPRQTRLVHIAYGDPEVIYRLRSQYPKRTYALFANKIEGLGWESNKNAWRLYFDPRNAIDLYGKRREAMFLDFAATPEYPYHADTINGRDIFRIGNAIGIGAVGAWVDGKLIKVADVSACKWKIISNGPVRSIVEITYEAWKVGGKSVNLRSRIVQWAGDRGFFHTITAEGAEGITFATGLTMHERALAFRSNPNASPSWLATYGEQVVETGPTPQTELTGTNLGLVIIMPAGKTSSAEDDLNYLMTFSLEKSSASWYVAAAWDQEGIANDLAFGLPAHKPVQASNLFSALKTRKDFLSWIEQRKSELSAPASVKFLQ